MSNPILPIILVYAIMAVATIVVMYRGDQPRYIKAKAITSALFLVLGFVCWRMGDGGPDSASWLRILLGLCFCFGGISRFFIIAYYPAKNKLNTLFFMFRFISGER